MIDHTEKTKEASQVPEDMLVMYISHKPNLVYLAEEVQRTRTQRLLRRDEYTIYYLVGLHHLLDLEHTTTRPSPLRNCSAVAA